MNTLHEPRLHIAVHYAIGIFVGLTIAAFLHFAVSNRTLVLVESHEYFTWKDLLNYDHVRLDSIFELTNSIETKIESDGLGALNELKELQVDPTLQTVVLASITHTMAEELGGFQQLFNVASEELEDDILQAFLWTVSGAWVQTDPIGAFAAVTQLKNKLDREELWKSIIVVWAESSPESLKALIHIMPEGVEKHAQQQLKSRG